MKPQYNTNDLCKIPPQATDIEEAVLGALMLEKGAYDKISLKPCEFYKEQHQKIFAAIQEIEKEGNPIDIFTVSEKLKNKGQFEEIGGPYFISSLPSKVANASSIDTHALIIHDKFIKRQLIAFSSALQTQAYDDQLDTFDVLDFANSELDKVNNETLLEDDIPTFREVIKKTMSLLAERAKLFKEGKSIGIPTPLKRLTKYTSGWLPKQFIILAARPSVGKTAFAIAIAKTAAISGKKVFLASLEMSNTQIGGRFVVGASGVNADNFKFGNLEPYEWEKLERSVSEIIDLQIYIDDIPKNINRIKSKAKLLHRKGQCDIIILDYIQLAGAGEEKKNQQREQEISYVSRTCKLLAQELDIPVIALSQLNRGIENRSGIKRPQLSDLRDSGAIEQDADVVMFINRPFVYGITEIEDGDGNFIQIDHTYAEIILAKNRDGHVGDIDFKFNESLTKVFDSDYTEPQQFQPKKTEYNPNQNIEPNTQFDNETPF
jgi:replicative DNA helicase